MAEAAPNVPTFKLVLVGDGGTGKVCSAKLPLDIALVAVAAISRSPTFLWRRRITYDQLTLDRLHSSSVT